MRRLALLDADIVAYKVASRNEEHFDFNGDGEGVSFTEDYDAICEDADKVVNELADSIKAGLVVICLSDEERNFRKELYPPYKLNRKALRRPEYLYKVKEYLAEEYESYIRPGLEADDVMGILATNPKLFKGYDKIIVSEDKDMRTIPHKVFNPNHADLGVLEISELDADRFLLWQAIVGDQTDGYPGCPGVGKASVYAEEIIGADREELWDIVLEAYASKGLTEDDAILQTRLARILRHEDWDYKKKEPRLWLPTNLMV